MNTKNANPQAAVKKRLASYSIWYRVCLGIFATGTLLFLAALIGWFTGHTLDIFFGIDGLFLEMAMKNNYLIMYMNYWGVLVSLAMIAYGVYLFFICPTERETTFDRFRNYLIFCVLSVWSVPLFNALSDFVMVGSRIRSVLSYDIFDMGLDAIPSLVVTGVSIALLGVNIFLSDVPADADIE
jgi:hypothetical protein